MVFCKSLDFRLDFHTNWTHTTVRELNKAIPIPVQESCYTSIIDTV